MILAFSPIALYHAALIATARDCHFIRYFTTNPKRREKERGIKIYNFDPLLCSRCNGRMHVIACIDDDQFNKKIVEHLDLRDVKRKAPPPANVMKQLRGAL